MPCQVYYNPLVNWIYDPNTKNVTEFVHAKIPVPNLSAEEWFTFSKTATFVHILELSAELLNETIPIKFVPLLKEISITAKKISVCPVVELRMKKTLLADLILAGIIQLTTVVLADKIHQHKYLRRLNPLIA